MSASERAAAGTPVHASGGEGSGPWQVYLPGMAPPAAKAGDVTVMDMGACAFCPPTQARTARTASEAGERVMGQVGCEGPGTTAANLGCVAGARQGARLSPPRLPGSPRGSFVPR